MFYPFECPKCGTKKTIEMPISEYKRDGHKCEKCGTEMVREISSLVCGMSLDKTGDFYSTTSI